MQTCGPIQPFGRVQNPDGTWTIGAYAQCEVPDPNPWSHIYTFRFPSTIVYSQSGAFNFVGSAKAYVEGHHDRVGRFGTRLVTVDNATLVDPAGNSIPLVKTETGSIQYPVDQWSTTTPLLSDTLYTFTVSGTDAGINPASDTLVISAIYEAEASSSNPDD